MTVKNLSAAGFLLSVAGRAPCLRGEKSRGRLMTTEALRPDGGTEEFELRTLDQKKDLSLTLRQGLASIRSRGSQMKVADEKLFKTREFAKLAGVTVRALHHYDRLRLLKPSRYTRAGYRLYSERDFARLEQIVALKFIGFPLKEIKRILNREAADLATALRRQ